MRDMHRQMHKQMTSESIMVLMRIENDSDFFYIHTQTDTYKHTLMNTYTHTGKPTSSSSSESIIVLMRIKTDSDYFACTHRYTYKHRHMDQK